MQLQWSHVVVVARDLNNMLDFHTNVLGFQITDRGAVAGDGSPEIVFLSQIPTDYHQIAFLDGSGLDGSGLDGSGPDGEKDKPPPNSVHHFAFRVSSLNDVKEMNAHLDEDGRARKITPLTHGNTWSSYFSDPEDNGLEVFCDSPWHVTQPAGEGWDTAKSNAEIETETRKLFEADASFGPIEEFFAKQSKRFGDA